MKNIFHLFCAGVLLSGLCTGLVGCNNETDNGLGEEISGMEIKQVTGTIIGGYSNGFGSLLVQVDEKYPIGKTLEYFDFMPCMTLPEDGTYKNMIQVQWNLPRTESKRISFSARMFEETKDRGLFTIGSGIGNAMCGSPNVPIYVITELNHLDN